MGSKSRSTGHERDEKSKRSVGKSEQQQQHRGREHRPKGSSSVSKGRQTGTEAGSSSKVEPSKRASTTAHRASPPARKQKPMPVNELDLLALSQKEQQAKSGNRGKAGAQDRPERMPYRLQRPGFVDRRGVWGSGRSGYGMRQGIDYRRTPMYPPRRGIGGGDLADQRTQYGRSGRQLYQRGNGGAEQRRLKDGEEKPVMNLFDPCKVPTGRSYFTHDDRATKLPRPVRPRYSASADGNGWQSLPVGWRNVRKVRRTDDDLRGDGYGDGGTSARKRLEKNPSDDVWKHDMFEGDTEGD